MNNLDQLTKDQLISKLSKQLILNRLQADQIKEQKEHIHALIKIAGFSNSLNKSLLSIDELKIKRDN